MAWAIHVERWQQPLASGDSYNPLSNGIIELTYSPSYGIGF